MTADEIRKALYFKTDKGTNHSIISATLTLTASLYCVTDAIDNDTMRRCAEDELVMLILRKLFQDRRNEMAEALYKLMDSDPFNMIAQSEAKEAIMKAAQFSYPDIKTLTVGDKSALD